MLLPYFNNAMYYSLLRRSIWLHFTLQNPGKVLNSSFLSRTCDSALSPIFSLHVTSLSFLHHHALSPLLNTSWPLNLMPWCSLCCTLSPSFLRALFVTRIPCPPFLTYSLFLTSCPVLSYSLPHSPSFFWPCTVLPFPVTSSLPSQPHSHCLSCLHTHFLCMPSLS